MEQSDGKLLNERSVLLGRFGVQSGESNPWVYTGATIKT